MRILIVEDNKLLAETLADLLEENSYLADTANDGNAGLDYALSNIYDAIILDVMLPRMNGYELVRRLRERNNSTPVLMLTAKCDLEDRVLGLNLGADYYLTKPFANAELLACLRALTRRHEDILPEELTFGDLTMTPSTRELFCGAKCIPLNAKELEMLRLLFINKNNYTPKETLLTKLWGYDSDAVENNVEAYASFLRKKLRILNSAVKLTVVRRIGYRLETEKDEK